MITSHGRMRAEWFLKLATARSTALRGARRCQGLANRGDSPQPFDSMRCGTSLRDWRTRQNDGRWYGCGGYGRTTERLRYQRSTSVISDKAHTSRLGRDCQQRRRARKRSEAQKRCDWPYPQHCALWKGMRVRADPVCIVVNGWSGERRR